MALASVGLLMKDAPPGEGAAGALREEGKQSERERQLPAEFLVYLVVSLSLYMPSVLWGVSRIVSGGLRTWEEVTGGGTIRIATKGGDFVGVHAAGVGGAEAAVRKRRAAVGDAPDAGRLVSEVATDGDRRHLLGAAVHGRERQGVWASIQ